jgi:hypothetical protein
MDEWENGCRGIRTRADEVLLHEVGLLEEALLLGAQVGEAGEDLIDRGHSSEVILHQVLDEVAADEASSTQNQHVRLAVHLEKCRKVDLKKQRE